MDISAQIAWEQEMARRGAETYYQQQDKIAQSGNLEQQDGYQFAMQKRILNIALRLESLESDKSAGINSKYTPWLVYTGKLLGYETIAFFATQILLRAIASGNKTKHITVTKTVSSIGERIETEIKCILFERENPAYYDLLQKSLAENKSRDYEHKRRVVMTKFKDYDTAWTDWDSATRVGVGSKVLQGVLDVMSDLVFINKIRLSATKSITKLDTTVEFDDWIAEFTKENGLLQPQMLPLKIAPMDWDETGVGGYYTPRMQQALPFIKAKGKEHKEFIDKFIPRQHLDAVNKMQQTAWAINEDVLHVIEEVYRLGLGFGLPNSRPIEPSPLPNYLQVDKEFYDEEMEEELKLWKREARASYFEETKRKGQVLSFMQTVKLARELSEWDKFYFAYSCDFRGRVYCATTCLSPQSNELSRSLLRFRESTMVTESGLFWLRQHGAGTFGIKGTHTEKAQWLEEATPFIKQIVHDPLTFTAWATADKPYQFLAFCFEWAKLEYGTDPTLMSNLVVGIDGSCNGLQHFSAILRDRNGAFATNLMANDKPQDIYGLVGFQASQAVQLDNDGWSQLWLHVGIGRALCKRPCMTLPYGATKQSCRDYTFEWVDDNWGQFNIDKNYRWKVSSYMSPFIWNAIEEVVPAAVTAMGWLHKNTSKVYHKWVSFVGFPVYQYYKKTKSIRINTHLAGGTRLSIRDIDDVGEPNIYKQRLGIVPNFIHSVDASHMVMTINESELPSYSMVHDEFGTHASHVQPLFEVTRYQFYVLHMTDQLALWAKHQGIDAEYLPAKGDYDIAEVLGSDYIFG